MPFYRYGFGYGYMARARRKKELPVTRPFAGFDGRTYNFERKKARADVKQAREQSSVGKASSIPIWKKGPVLISKVTGRGKDPPS